MNWDALGALGETVGAIAVVATLIYLARQVRQSVAFSRVSQYRPMVESYENYNDLVIANPAVAELLAGLEQEGKVTSAADNIRIRHLAYRLMNIYLSAQTAYTNGQIGAEEFAIFKLDVESTFDHYPGLMPYFESNLPRYGAMKDFEIYERLHQLLEERRNNQV
jgi:hypothetical protein